MIFVWHEVGINKLRMIICNKLKMKSSLYENIGYGHDETEPEKLKESPTC